MKTGIFIFRVKSISHRAADPSSHRRSQTGPQIRASPPGRPETYLFWTCTRARSLSVQIKPGAQIHFGFRIATVNWEFEGRLQSGRYDFLQGLNSSWKTARWVQVWVAVFVFLREISVGNRQQTCHQFYRGVLIIEILGARLSEIAKKVANHFTLPAAFSPVLIIFKKEGRKWFKVAKAGFSLQSNGCLNKLGFWNEIQEPEGEKNSWKIVKMQIGHVSMEGLLRVNYS